MYIFILNRAVANLIRIKKELIQVKKAYEISIEAFNMEKWVSISVQTDVNLNDSAKIDKLNSIKSKKDKMV